MHIVMSVSIQFIVRPKTEADKCAGRVGNFLHIHDNPAVWSCIDASLAKPAETCRNKLALLNCLSECLVYEGT